MRVILILLSIILFVSCNPSTTENKDEQLYSKPDSKVIKSDFREFWNNLGQALRVNDTIALDKYLDSTVFLYGREDQDPRFELNSRDRIIKVSEIYLTSGTYDYQNDINISYMDFFLDSNALNREYLEDQDNQAIEDFVFKRNKGDEWKLIGVYSDCKDCLKWYNENTGSPMYNIKKKHLWQEYLRHMQAGLSIKRIAKVMPISIQTSFDWRHKILSALASKAPLKLGKIVECDEMEIALSNKGEHGLKRKARKRGTDFKRNTADKRVTTVQVVTAVDREGNKYLKAVETKRLSSSQINKAIGKKITKGTLLITDEHPSYKGFVKTKSSIVHKPINAKLLKKSTDKKINLQRVNNTHKQLDDFLDRFNGVSSKYLQNYLNWFTCQKEFNQMANKVKTWCLAILTSTQAYDLFYEFKANAVNIRT